MLERSILHPPSEIRSRRFDTIAFTDSEAAAFWPVYKQYASDQRAIAAVMIWFFWACRSWRSS
jgi:hypothetical protein